MSKQSFREDTDPLTATAQRKVWENQGEIGEMSVNEPVDVFKHYQILNDDECWPWLGPWGGRSGIERRPYFQAGGKRQIAYRWCYELVHGITLTPDQLILHSCDHGSYPVGCGNVAHMRIGTHDDNMQDMTGRARHGLSHSVVRAIRKLLEQGRTQEEIATLYGVSREAISAIATRRAYGHLD